MYKIFFIKKLKSKIQAYVGNQMRELSILRLM